MTRAKAVRLALVNWKGLVYEEFELDAGVTALEGENGAGKTTVMIGAYTVLLPDLTYLRFANVGESSSGGGEAGIWGRLGTQGPAYAWLDIRMPRQRVVAGVHLHRLSRPRLELEPMIIEGATEDVALERLVMRAVDGHLEVPDPQDLRTLALTQGASIRTYGRKKKDYFSRLFELGITPVRMAVSDDRAKVNEMLKTCMMGGISNTLRTGLRDFLFSESGRLADTVRRMEQNLDACRVTRAKVERNAALEEEIRELYQAGQSAFLCALHGTARWEDEARGDVTKHMAAERELAGEESETADELERTLSEIESLEDQLQGLDERIGAAGQRASLVATALDLATRLTSESEDLRRCMDELDEARQAFDAAVNALDVAVKEEQRAERRRDEAARALSRYQDGYQELARKVGRYRHATRLLQEVVEALGRERIEISELHDLLSGTRAQAKALADEAAKLRLRLEDHEGHRARFERGRTLLQRALGRDLAGDDLRVAVSELDKLRRKLERAKDELPDLDQRVRAATKLAERQTQARQRGRLLGVASSAALSSAIRACEEDEQAAGQQLETLGAQLSALREHSADLARARNALQGTVGPWTQVQADAGRLSQGRDPVRCQDDLIALHGALSKDLDLAQQALRQLRERLDITKERCRSLDLSGDLPAWVLHARDVVDADLVAEHFDDVPVDEAAVCEAVLGQRAAALLVQDFDDAATKLATEGVLQPGQELLLLDSLPTVSDPEGLDQGCVLVREDAATRLVHPSDTPVLGRAAREKAVAALALEIESLEEEELRLDARVDALQKDLELATSLLPRAQHLDQPDPRERLAEIRSQEAGVQEQQNRLADQQAAIENQRRGLQDKLRKLRALLSVASLLDDPDHVSEARALEARRSMARADARRLADLQPCFVELDGLRSDLQRTPLAKEEAGALRAQAEELQAQRAVLVPLLQALEELVDDPEPLGWAHFVPVLDAQEALGPAMEAERQEAEAALARARASKTDAQKLRDDARDAKGDAASAVKLAEARREETALKLAETGIENPSQSMLDDARANLGRLKKSRKELGTRKSELDVSKGRLASVLQGIRDRLQQTRGKLTTAREEHGRRLRTLESFRAEIREASLDLDWLMAQQPEATGSPNLFSEAKAGRGLVAKLLQRQPGSEALMERYSAAAEGGSTEHVAAWVDLRRELHQRIPPDISEAPDVLAALEELGRGLHRLRRTLTERERDLRTDAKAIGSTIQSQRRRAANKVRELSRALGNVRFGTVKRIELKVKPVRKMNELLDALAGEVDLFRDAIPIEQALERAFESIGGGKVQASRLLDYRRYFEVKVLVEKTDGARDGARGDQMSTGEAIGVGAAIMMIVLRAWEDEASKLRKHRGFGTMRLLFLDEATRLSRDSLEVLFDLCRELELQLLIAAPDVDRVEGATTYTLTRTPDGARVDIHGRRVVARALEG